MSKERKLINDYRKKLNHIINLVQKDQLNYEAIIKLIKQYVSSLNNYSLGFSLDYLERALERNEQNYRYQFFVDHSMREIIEVLYSIIESIDEYTAKIDGTYVNPIVEKINLSDYIVDDITENDDENDISINIIAASVDNSSSVKKGKMYSYYLSKLVEKKHVDYIDVLIDENIDNTTLVNELSNMNLALLEYNDFEYYCSYIYVRSLLDEYL